MLLCLCRAHHTCQRELLDPGSSSNFTATKLCSWSKSDTRGHTDAYLRLLLQMPYVLSASQVESKRHRRPTSYTPLLGFSFESDWVVQFDLCLQVDLAGMGFRLDWSWVHVQRAIRHASLANSLKASRTSWMRWYRAQTSLNSRRQWCQAALAFHRINGLAQHE